MGIGSVPYCFEGTMRPTCSKCHTTHELVFSGSDECSIEIAMEEAMATEGWSVGRMLCPECNDSGLYDTEGEEEPLDDDDGYDELLDVDEDEEEYE